jgi:radical SAM-linked protein
MTRLRLRYTKVGKIRFIGHRDLARVWERALRRSALNVASTEGFSPRPKVHFGLALSTGFESLAEFIDVDLDPAAPQPDLSDTAALVADLSLLLPEGIDVTAGAVVDRGQSLQAAVASCSWRILVEAPPEGDLAAAVDHLGASPTLIVPRDRKGKHSEVEVRPSLDYVGIVGPATVPGWDVGTELQLELRTVSPALKVSELLSLLLPETADTRVRRTHHWIEGDGGRHEPLPVSEPAHAGVCAP